MNHNTKRRQVSGGEVAATLSPSKPSAPVPPTFFDKTPHVGEMVLATKEMLDELQVKELKQLLQLKGCPQWGSKSQLIDRLISSKTTKEDLRTLLGNKKVQQNGMK